MDREEFNKNIDLAINSLFELSERYCFNKFPDEILFDIVFVNPNEIDYLNNDNQIIIKQILSSKLNNISKGKIKELLWQNGKTPLYVDMTISHISKSISYIELFASKRFTNNSDSIMHKEEGYPPFHIQVRMPPNFNENEKFDINHWYDINKPTLKKIVRKWFSI